MVITVLGGARLAWWTSEWRGNPFTIQSDTQHADGSSAAFISVRRDDRPTILVVDADEGARRMLDVALRQTGVNVTTVGSGAEGIRAAIRTEFDLIFLDLNLGDVSGIDVIRAIRDTRNPRFVVISGSLSVGAVVEVMKLGALDVIEKPIDVGEVVRLACTVLGQPKEPAPAHAPRPELAQPRSVAERWVGYVIRGCAANADFKTLGCWARETAVSYSTLCAICRLVGIRPLDARDFTRLLRALRRAAAHRCAPGVFLDVSDERTVRTLSIRANVNLESEAGPSSVIEFLTRQRLVPSGHHGLHILRALLQEEYDLGRLTSIHTSDTRVRRP